MSNNKNTGRAESRTPTYLEVEQLLSKESDRGAILILAAQIEELLGSLISEVCTSKQAAEAILKNGQPAGTFEHRVLLCQALGLIHNQEVNALRIIQKIRNKAAHFDRNGRGFNVLFDSSATVDQVMALLLLLEFDKPKNEPTAIRVSFIEAVQHLAAVISFRHVGKQSAVEPISLKETATQYLENSSYIPEQECFSTPAYHLMLCGLSRFQTLLEAGLTIEDLKNKVLNKVRADEEAGFLTPGTASSFFSETEE